MESGTETNPRLCPKCSTRMGRIVYEKSGVSMDKCLVSHGVWLSHGEFERIVRHLEKEVNAETAGGFQKEAGRRGGPQIKRAVRKFGENAAGFAAEKTIPEQVTDMMNRMSRGQKRRDAVVTKMRRVAKQ